MQLARNFIQSNTPFQATGLSTPSHQTAKTIALFDEFLCLAE